MTRPPSPPSTPEPAPPGDVPRPRLRRTLIFGIVAATLEMGLVLWLMYC